jgi:uncharacterized protein (DUF362 family)
MSSSSGKAKVALARCQSYEPRLLLRALDKLVDALGGWEAFVRPGERILLKPNLLKGVSPDRAVTTHPELLRALGRRLKAHGARPAIGDSPAWGSFGRVAEATGIADVARQEGIELVAFSQAREISNDSGLVYQRLIIDEAVLEADGLINCPKLKTHDQLYMTGAVKNLFGCVPGKRKAWWHFKAGMYDNYFARMLVEVAQLVGPRLHIMDAVLAMEGRGPARGRPRPLGFLAASTDPVALDRVCLALVGGNPERLRTLAAARELGVGETQLENIHVVGERPEELAVEDFAFPSLLPIGFSLPRVVKSTLKNQWMVHVRERRKQAT